MRRLRGPKVNVYTGRVNPIRRSWRTCSAPKLRDASPERKFGDRTRRRGAGIAIRKRPSARRSAPEEHRPIREMLRERLTCKPSSLSSTMPSCASMRSSETLVVGRADSSLGKDISVFFEPPVGRTGPAIGGIRTSDRGQFRSGHRVRPIAAYGGVVGRLVYCRALASSSPGWGLAPRLRQALRRADRLGREPGKGC